jgi:biogenesis of lysosome-related organelles complex 1 subunit KXD1
MASTSYSYDGYYPMASQPIAMPQKSSDYMATYDPVDYQISSSPPEVPDSGTTSGITSYDPSAASASYAASASDFDGSSGTSSIDLLEFMNERLQSSYDPTPMDTSLVQQAQA